MKANNKTREEIYQIVQAWKDSGLTQQSFCQQEHLILITFASWVKKVRDQENAAPVSLVPLQIDGYCSPTSSGFEIEYPNGVRLRLSEMPSGEELSRIIHIYREPCFH